MVYRPNIDHNLVFVIMPFGAPFDGYYEQIIKPVANELGRRALRSDEMYGTGAIVADIWAHIWQAAVVVADVTGKNPNVNYELGLCHALGVPTVLMTRNIDDVPFDYRHRRCIRYDTNQAGWETKLKSDLRNTVESVFASSDPASGLEWPYDTTAAQRLPPRGELVETAEGLERIVRGAQLVCDVLERSFGPSGHRVAVRTARGIQRSSRNGALLAGSIHATDPVEAIGAEEMKRVVSEMQSAIGDGTKTAAIIAREMLIRAAATVHSGVPIDRLVRGMERAVQAALGAIESEAKPVIGTQLRQLGQTAAQDPMVGAVVEEAFDRVGKYGIVTVEKTIGSSDFSVDVIQGIQIDRGFVSDAFVTNPRAAECTLDEPLILLCEYKLTAMREILPLLEDVARAGRQLLIVADDIEAEALSTLIVNQQRGTLRSCAVKAPGFGDRRRHLLEDLASLTGGVALTAVGGRALSSLRLSDLGSARTVTVTSSETTIIEGRGQARAIEERIEYIKAELSRGDEPIERAKLQERLAKMAGALAIIRPGGVTPAESEDRAVTVTNAMHACHAAIEGGWVVGGGWASAYAANAVQDLESLDSIDRAARDCVISALEAPLRHLPRLAISSDTDGLAAAKERLRTDGVLDPSLLVSRGLSIAWSHVRTIIQTGAWDVAPVPPLSEDEE